MANIGPTPPSSSGSGQGPSHSKKSKGLLGSRSVEQKSPGSKEMDPKDAAVEKTARRTRGSARVSQRQSQSLASRVVSSIASTVEAIRFSKAAISLFGTPGKVQVFPSQQAVFSKERTPEQQVEVDRVQIKKDINRLRLTVDEERLASVEHPIASKEDGLKALEEHLDKVLKGSPEEKAEMKAKIFSMFQQQSSSFYQTDIMKQQTEGKEGADLNLGRANFTLWTGAPIELTDSIGKKTVFQSEMVASVSLNTETDEVIIYSLIDRNFNSAGDPQPNFPTDQCPARILYRTTYNYKTNEYKIDRLDPRVWDRQVIEIDKMEQFGGLAPREQQPKEQQPPEQPS